MESLHTPISFEERKDKWRGKISITTRNILFLQLVFEDQKENTFPFTCLVPLASLLTQVSLQPEPKSCFWKMVAVPTFVTLWFIYTCLQVSLVLSSFRQNFTMYPRLPSNLKSSWLRFPGAKITGVCPHPAVSFCYVQYLWSNSEFLPCSARLWERKHKRSVLLHWFTYFYRTWGWSRGLMRMKHALWNWVIPQPKIATNTWFVMIFPLEKEKPLKACQSFIATFKHLLSAIC